MILSCPECGTQYTLKESQLGPRGRTVRCTSCRHTWHAEIPIDLRYSEPKTRKDRDEPEEDLQSVKAEKLPGKYRAMLQDKKRIQALAVEFSMWGGMAALILLVLALGYFLRVDIVKAFPRVAGAYAMVGLDVKGTNLRFVSQSALPVLKGGRFVVTVQAKVTNIGDQPEPVPPIRVKTQDSSLQPFGSVLMPSGDLTVAPRATRTLTFDIADPENKVAHLDLDFDLVAMKKAQKGRKPAAADHAVAAGSEDGTQAPQMAEAAPPAAIAPAPIPANTAEIVPPTPATDTEAAPQDSDVSTQVIDTGTPQQSLSRKPAHPLRGALSFSDDNTQSLKASNKTSRLESKS